VQNTPILQHVCQDNVGKVLFIIKQKMMDWQWHQLAHMQIILTSLQTD